MGRHKTEEDMYNATIGPWFKSSKPSPPSYCNEGSPGTTETPLEPGDVCTVHGDALVDAVQELGISLDRSMKAIKARIDLIEARLHHIKELLIHDEKPFCAPNCVRNHEHYVNLAQPPSSSHTHGCHRGLTYREEQSLAKMCQWLEVQEVQQGSQPTTSMAGSMLGKRAQGRKSTP